MDKRQETKWDRGETTKSSVSDGDKIAIGAFYEAELEKGRTSNDVVEELE